jgi:hypothetical protein
VIQGEGASHWAGEENAAPVILQVTSETGQPVAGAAVSFHFPKSGPTAQFANQLRTQVVQTDARGLATSPRFKLAASPGWLDLMIVVTKEQSKAATVCKLYIAPR